MGCVYSRVEREEAVRRCRERRRLMKQLVECRAKFAAAHLAYLQSLRNTGATLRQFAEADSSVVLLPGDAASTTTATTGGGGRRVIRLPPSPPPLPPSPPPLPPFSPDPRAKGEEEEEEEARRMATGGRGGRDEEEEDRDETVRDESTTLDGCDADEIHPPPPPDHAPAWGFWDPFDASSPSNSASPAAQKKDAAAAVAPAVEDEDWAETKTEFEDDEDGGEDNAGAAGASAEAGLNLVVREKLLLPGRGEFLADDNSSAVSSWFTKDTDAAVVVWRSKKTLPEIVGDLDDYFLKASAGGTKVAAVLESNRASSLHRVFEETKGKNLKSAKVFSSLSWRWSSKSPQSGMDAAQGVGGARQSGSLCGTLDKLFAEEQKLYKEVKEEEMAKLQYRKKMLLLQKQEAREQDWAVIAKTRSSIEELQSEIMSLQESISNICSSISRLRDEELHLQLVELCGGLMQMWRTMYECHQVQNHIAHQMNHLHNLSSMEPTTDSHRHATAQLETEVDSWYNAFYNLLRTQREYAQTLNQWVRLTDCLPTNGPLGASGIFVLCEEWQLALERLPEKVAAEAIKSFVSVVHSIGLQLAQELNLQKKSERLEKKLLKELNSLREMERKQNTNYVDDMISTPILSDPPLSPKHAKLDAHKKRVEDEKSKYLNSVRLSRIMMINNLQTSLPNVFQALTGFASVCVQAFEGIYRPHEATVGRTNGGSPSSEIP